jgi:hypothetical protein
MNTRKQCLVSGVIAALMVPLVHAAEPLHCNELFNDAQRLGCYDAVFGKPAIVGAQANAPSAPVAAAAAATATAAAAVPAPAPAKSAAKPETFKSSITALGKSADGRFIATLENGGQWLQTERDSRNEVKVGDAVTLQPGMFSSWTLETKSGYTARVKQLK